MLDPIQRQRKLTHKIAIPQTILTRSLRGTLIVLLTAVTNKPKVSVTSHNYGLILAHVTVHCETRGSAKQLSCRWWLRDPGSAILRAFTSGHVIRQRIYMADHTGGFMARSEIGIRHIHSIILARTSHMAPS